MAIITLGLSGAGISSQHLFVQQDLQPVASKQTVAAPRVRQPASFQQLDVAALSASQPVRLRIDKIKLNAPIVSTGLKSDGTLNIPGPADVGWYDQSPTPGEIGPAVLVGHVDYLHSKAIFWHLRELTGGDTFTISRADGSSVTFQVDSIQQFGQESFPSELVYGATDYPGIRLITCGGTFNHQTHHYSQNTVVFARMISSS